MSGSQDFRKPRKVDVAYDELRRLIVTLELEPGAMIDERQLIERLDIGRTPVREAIQRLIHEGMIIHNPRRGSWVSPLSFTDMENLIEARRMLEIECARRAACRISPDRLGQMRDEVDQTGEVISSGDGVTSVSVDQYFHTEIARASGNRYLVRLTEQLHHDLTRYWYVSAIRVGRLGIVVSHHHRILDAIESGDPDYAEQALDEHVTLFRERLSALVSGAELLASGASATIGNYLYQGLGY